MPKITKVNIQDLVAASQKHVTEQVGKANLNKNGYLTPTEAKGLSKDLQDNFATSQFKQPWGSVKTADLTREFTVLMEAFAHSADKNHDGSLSATEAKALPQSLRDNFANYLAAQNAQVTDVSGYVTRNETPAATVQAHQAAFGSSPVSYEAAFAKAIEAAATDEYGLAMFVREFGGPDGDGLEDPAAIAAEVKSLLKNGSMELLAVDDEIPTGESNADAWIFSVRTDGQGDHGVWAIVDRKTGETSVSSFN